MVRDELLEAVQAEVEEMTEEELEQEANRILAQQAKRREYTRKRVMSPEAKEKQKEYRQKRYQRDRLVLAKAAELGLVEVEEPVEDED